MAPAKSRSIKPLSRGIGQGGKGPPQGIPIPIPPMPPIPTAKVVEMKEGDKMKERTNAVLTIFLVIKSNF